MPSEVRFAEVRKFLEHHGWTLVRISGSHYIFRKEGEQGITIPVRRGEVLPVYVRKVEKAVGGKLR
jgi:predicted RNA binding protein YcfA (HicA-like mRNA interferase family)